MLTALSHMTIWARDQDEAKAFYVDTLGFELGTDITVEEFGNIRWLTVRAPNGVEIVLANPDSAAFRGPDAPDQIRAMLASGLLGGGIFRVDDCRATYEELRAKGVEFTDEPAEQFYGIDAGFRDPSGNQWRMTQPAAGR